MTISSTLRKAGPYPGNGSAATFPFSFKVFEAADVVVVRLEDATSIETTLALNTDFTVALNVDQNSNPGGSITLTAGNLATGFQLVITSDIQPLQQTDLTNQGGFYPEVINDALDRSMILIQQQGGELDRSIKFSLTNTIGSLEISENATARANKVLGFDSSGEFQVTQELGTYKGDWTTATSYVIRDIVKDPSNQNVYMCVVTHTSSGAAPIKTNAGLANWSLLINAEAAGLSAAAAAQSAIDADASAQDAATDAGTAVAARDAAIQARDASLQAEIDAQAAAAAAALSATNAATSETNADQSAQDAAASAAAAANAAGGGTVRVTTNDTTADVLDNKFVAGQDIELTLLNPGGAEQIRIAAPYVVAYAIALGG